MVRRLMKWWFLYLLALSIIVTAYIIIAYVGYLYFLDANPAVKYNNQPFNVLGVNGTNKFLIEFDVCKYTDNVAEVDMYYVDGVTYSIPTVIYGSLRAGQCDKYVRLYELPAILPDGKYIIIAKVRIAVNALVVRTYSWETEEFVIKDGQVVYSGDNDEELRTVYLV